MDRFAQGQDLFRREGRVERGRLKNAKFLIRGVVTDSIPQPVDVVVTTGAGYPLDTTFYQSIKGLVAALPIVKPGGTIVMAASLSEGIGSDDFQRGLRDNPDLTESQVIALRDLPGVVVDGDLGPCHIVGGPPQHPIGD